MIETKSHSKPQHRAFTTDNSETRQMKKATKTNYWMVRQEPETYSWDNFVNDGSTDWSGVRNYQARNNLKGMKVGDRVLFYHSGKGKEVVGLAEVIKGA